MKLNELIKFFEAKVDAKAIFKADGCKLYMLEADNFEGDPTPTDVIAAAESANAFGLLTDVYKGAKELVEALTSVPPASTQEVDQLVKSLDKAIALSEEKDLR